MTRRISLSMPALTPALDTAEVGLVDRGMAWLSKAQPRDLAVLKGQIKRLVLLAQVLEQTPSLVAPSTLGGTTRDDATLIARLSHLDPLEGELLLPEKAVMARAFLVAKISLLRAFLVSLAPDAPGQNTKLYQEFRGELSQSVYTAIATEILVGLLLDPIARDETKVKAARQLILVWDGAVKVEIDDFCPMLEAAWKARSTVPAQFGSLLGAGEYMRLLQHECPPQFLEYFTRDDVTPDEVAAFEEFLFGVTSEELACVRAAMRDAGRAAVDAGFVAQVLGRPMRHLEHDNPEEVYASFHRRRLAAELRRLRGTPGPPRAAEAYIMTYVLQQI